MSGEHLRRTRVDLQYRKGVTMTALDWRTVFPRNERQIYEAAGFCEPQEFGRSPALLIIDVVVSFTGRANTDIFDSIKEYRTSCGAAGVEAVNRIAELLEAAREHGVPVVYTKGNVADKYHSGDSVKGTKPEEVSHIYGAPIVPTIEPRDTEYVVEKAKASAFFGTPLATYLHRSGIDTLLVCGTSTSGCVRASVVDAFSHGYRVFLVEECVFDRSPLSHAVNLFEMNAKYASVVHCDQALGYIESCQEALA
jgi:nicotinamidase-related amidase